jgi:CubicO group peptidase (beta-lactamase class C family)
MAAPKRLLIDGSVSSRYEPVRKAFIENFTRRGELGAACCIYQHGEKVVDLWGGVRDRVSGDPWRADTLVVVHSTTKGLAAMVMALAHSRGWLDYDARVATYWPEFAQNGKERTTVRQLLAHQAGLFAFDEPEAASAPRSMGYADPETGIGYGYVTNRMGVHLEGDPRDVALRAAIPTSSRSNSSD